MTKYRRRPVEIEAFQYDGDFMNSNGDYYVPDWAVGALNEGVLYYKDAGDLYIKTLEGDMLVPVGNFIIKGVVSEIYSCRPDIFEKTYYKKEV